LTNGTLLLEYASNMQFTGISRHVVLDIHTHCGQSTQSLLSLHICHGCVLRFAPSISGQLPLLAVLRRWQSM
jgi:hypothetical protein